MAGIIRVDRRWRVETLHATSLLTRSADLIAGLLGAIHEAKRARDMRKYPFWARGAEYTETVLLPAPRKILRDSPTRRDTPKK